MKKALATICAAVALALPAAPAGASEIPPPAGIKDCPAPYVDGFILWIDTRPTGYHEEWFCIPGGPRASEDAGTARVGVTRCGPTTHFIVWYYDENDEYRELWNSCI